MAGWYEGIQPPGLEASAHPDPLTHPHETQAVWHRESSPGWGQDAQLLRLAVLPGPWVTLGQSLPLSMPQCSWLGYSSFLALTTNCSHPLSYTLLLAHGHS